MDNVIYDRQKDLPLQIPSSVAVIGIGGVGSWVALDFALTGVQKLILVDHDKVEEHNLNRTPFCLRHVGTPKVEALAELIFERRLDIQVLPIQKRLEDLTEYEIKMLEECETIVDCRDTSNPPLPENLQKKQRITGGYDGFNITIHLNPSYKKIWGDEPSTYTVTPSWLAPPQLIANIITAYIVCPQIQQNKEKTKNFNIAELVKQLLT